MKRNTMCGEIICRFVGMLFKFHDESDVLRDVMTDSLSDFNDATKSLFMPKSTVFNV